MKKYFATLTASVLISMAPYALAASSTDLTVTGTITPSACTPSLSSGAVVDFGKISAKDLQPTAPTLIGEPTTQLSVSCDAPTTFALHAIDNRPNTTVSGYFGVGLTPAGEKLGHYIPTISNVLADGQVATPIISPDQGATWSPLDRIRADHYLSVSSPADTSAPITAKDLTMDLAIRTWILPANGLTLTGEVPIDGSATFEMKYL